jgi:uncharacterized protein
MKYLVLIIVVLAVLWLARALRKPKLPSRPVERLPEQEEMVACAQCGVHLPRSEALPGRGGVFCSEAHRGTFERQRES